MPNPLANLCQQLGLSPEAIAGILGRPAGIVRDALCDEPKEPLASYLRLSAALGVKMVSVE